MKPWKRLLTIAGIRLVSLLLSCCRRLLFLLPVFVTATLQMLATVVQKYWIKTSSGFLEFNRKHSQSDLKRIVPGDNDMGEEIRILPTMVPTAQHWYRRRDQAASQRLPSTCSCLVSLGSHLQSPHRPNHPSSHHGPGLSSVRNAWLSLAMVISLTFPQDRFNKSKNSPATSFTE